MIVPSFFAYQFFRPVIEEIDLDSMRLLLNLNRYISGMSNSATVNQVERLFRVLTNNFERKQKADIFQDRQMILIALQSRWILVLQLWEFFVHFLCEHSVYQTLIRRPNSNGTSQKSCPCSVTISRELDMLITFLCSYKGFFSAYN